MELKSVGRLELSLGQHTESFEDHNNALFHQTAAYQREFHKSIGWLTGAIGSGIAMSSPADMTPYLQLRQEVLTEALSSAPGARPLVDDPILS